MRKVTTLVAILAATLILSGCQLKFPLSKQTNPPATQITTPETEVGTPKKSAHYESNTPAHGTILAGVPINVVINFNFDLASPSKIEIKKDGVDFGVGETVIDANKLTMRRKMDPAAPEGIYKVAYNACWPDGTCHDGSFEFAINRAKAGTFVDMTGQNEVSINLKNFMFEPKNVRIKKGTKVTWTNSDSTAHYVNTDSHPAHTYILDMNSQALEESQTYSYTFETAGIYPYHCSAHASTMAGNILVE